MQNDIDNPYLQKCAQVFKTDADDILLMRLSNVMPLLARPLHDILFFVRPLCNKLITKVPSLRKYISESPHVWLLSRVQDVVDLRMQSSSDRNKRVDLLQLMIDATTHDQVIVSYLSFFKSYSDHICYLWKLSHVPEKE